MKYEPFDPLIRQQCRKVKVKKDLAGGLIKKGEVVYAYHKFRIFLPKPKGPTPPEEVARFDIDVGLFDAYLEEEKKPAKPVAK